MTIYLRDRTVYATGLLDEKFDFEGFKKILAEEGKSSLPLLLDLSGVERSNSTGLLSWIRLTRVFEGQLGYVRAPIWLVEQFGELSEFFTPRISVQSFFAPFFCRQEDKAIPLLLETGKDVPFLTDYREFQIKKVCDCGIELEPDFDSHDYLSFLAVVNELRGDKK